MRKIALEQAREREKKRDGREKKRGNEQTLELLQQRNICRWRSPFQSQHGGMIGASTGSYVYPRICGSFFPALRSSPLGWIPLPLILCSSSFPRARPSLAKKSLVAFSQENLERPSPSPPPFLPSCVRSRALVRKEETFFPR